MTVSEASEFSSAEIEAGRYDCVLVMGVEEFKNLSGNEASVNQNAAAWQGHEDIDALRRARLPDEIDRRQQEVVRQQRHRRQQPHDAGRGTSGTSRRNARG